MKILYTSFIDSKFFLDSRLQWRLLDDHFDLFNGHGFRSIFYFERDQQLIKTAQFLFAINFAFLEKSNRNKRLYDQSWWLSLDRVLIAAILYATMVIMRWETQHITAHAL